jgi:hypothetical protein
VFENRVLRRIFGPKRDEVMEGRRKPLCGMYSLPRIIIIIKPRWMRLERHVAQLEKVIGRKAREKEATWKPNTEVGG